MSTQTPNDAQEFLHLISNWKLRYSSNVSDFSQSPVCQMTTEVCREFIAMRRGAKIACAANVIFLLPLAMYFCDEIDWSSEILDGGKQPSTGDSLSSVVASTNANFKEFLATSLKVNPLYLIPPFAFVVAISVLNVVSYSTLRTPLIGRAWKKLYRYFAGNFADPRWVRDFTLDVRPLLLTWFLLVPPVLIAFMFLNFCRAILQPFVPAPTKDRQFGIECLKFRQQIDRSNEPERTNFYNSPWFTAVILLPFILGIPGAISLWIFFHTGVNATFGHPEYDPQYREISKIIFYIYPLSWCLCALFFRSYFTFAWNFVSTEFDIEIYPDMIKALPLKGWFSDFLSFRYLHCPSQILWNDVVSIKFESAKLDTATVQNDNPLLATVRKLSSVYESVANKLEMHTDCLVIKTKARSISFRLWELSDSQKLQLFQAIRKYAPLLHLDAAVQHALVGSSVLREPKYTEIWFSVLTSGNEPMRDGDLQNGQILRSGRYTITAKVASGGQAVVYQANEADSGVVILKEFQLTPGESLDVKIESAKDFENESALLDQLSHFAIVKLLDMFYEEGRMYLVLEHVEGVSLRQRVAEKGKLSPQEIATLAEQMCDILRYLHSQIPPVVHRDFTPDNLILQPDGKLKLIDFSVAQRRKEKGVSSDCAGKHSYTPPEQFRGETEPQSDIYALGATLYFLASGQDPMPITESSLTPGVSPDPERDALSNIIERATKLNIADRYESVDWLLTDLRSAYPLGAEPTDQPCPSNGQAPAQSTEASQGNGSPDGSRCENVIENSTAEAGKISLEESYKGCTAKVRIDPQYRRSYSGIKPRRHLMR